MPSAQENITQLPAAGPITGSELVPIVQNGATVRTTTQAISSAPNQQQTFLTVNQEPTLPNSRYLSTDSNLSITNGGAQSYLRLNLTGAAASLNSASDGFISKTGTTVTPRVITASGAGLSVINGSGVSGNPTISLSGQIVNFATASGNGLMTLTSGGAVSATYLQGVAGQTVVTNGNGISGPPTVGFDDNATFPGTGAIQVPQGTTAQRPTGVVGKIRYNLTDSAFEGYANGSWKQFSLAGGVTQVNSGNGLTGGPITGVGTLSIDTSVVSTLTGSQTLTNKTISGSNNTLTNIGNASLTNSAITINGNTISLGGTATVTAANPFALTIGTGLSGASYDGSSAVTIAIDSTVATLTGTQTLTNKTISGSTNSLSNIGNSSLVNSAVVINGNAVSLGGSTTVTASTTNALTIGTGLSGTSFNGGSAVTIAIDSTVATLSGTQTLTNKSISGSTNTLSNIPNSALTNSSITIGTTPISLGATSSTLGGLTRVALTQDPANALDAATKQYVDAAVSNTNYHAACNYATTADLGAVTYNNGSSGVGATITKNPPRSTLSIDGATPSVGQRILVKNQTAGAQNGIYVVTTVGSSSVSWVLTRATDYDQTGTGTGEINAGDTTYIISGATNAGTQWVQTTQQPITIGTTALVFAQIAGPGAYTAGTGLSLTGTQFSISNTGVSTGTYGSASTVPVVTVNAQGQLTTVTNTAIAIANTQVSGLGTMSTQNANNVAITGGAIDGTPIGATTASTGKFTTVTATTGIFGGAF